MINKICNSDNRTSFGSYFVLDKHNYLNKLLQSTIENSSAIKIATEHMASLRTHNLGQELEIIEYGTVENCRYVKILNKNTGFIKEIKQDTKFEKEYNFLPKILENLELLSSLGERFFDETTPQARLYKLLTGQKA